MVLPSSEPKLTFNKRDTALRYVFVAAFGATSIMGLYLTGARASSSDEISQSPEELLENRKITVEPLEEEQVNVAVLPVRQQDGDLGLCELQEPLTELQMAEVLQQGYEIFHGVPPSANRLACAWAHCAIEHARGEKVFGNNLGHITTTGVWKGPTCQKSFTHRVGTDPDRWASTTLTFRVHETLLSGAVDYWKLLSLHYPTMMLICDRGEPLEAAKELRRRQYFTGPEEPYVESVARLYLEGLGRILPKMQTPPWPIGPRPASFW